MSIGTGISAEQVQSPAAASEKGQPADTTSETANACPKASTTSTSNTESADCSEPSKSTSSLLSSLWTPISSLLQSPKTVSEPRNDTTLSNTGNTTTNTTEQAPAPASATPSEPTPSSKAKSNPPEPDPEPYYTPTTVPLFKALQKKRLSGTRTKQLLRAASRAYNDPPPPPELGSCCGSSCDPCVNDLWKEERDVWRGRWGDRRVEGDSGDGRKGLEW